MSYLPYLLHLGTLCALYALLSQSLNVVLGLGRAFNLAHIASYAVGAYVTALFATQVSSEFLSAAAWSIVACAAFSLLLGWVALRLASDYFAIGTLAFAAVVQAVLINWKSVTGGVLGIAGIPRPTLGALEFGDELEFFLLALAVAVVGNLLLFILLRSPYGRALRAVGEAPNVARALGISPRTIGTVAYVVSAVGAGLAGSLFAFFLNYIDPSSFSLSEMVLVLTMVVVGRPGSFWGVLVGACGLVLLPEALRFVEMPSSILGPARQALYAVVLFVTVYVMREKLFPSVRSI